MVRGRVRTVDPSSSPLCRSAKDIILRSKQTALIFIHKRCQRRHKISVDVRRVAISSHFILNVVFLEIDIFAEIL